MRLLKSDYSGDNLVILHTQKTQFLDPASDVDVHTLLMDNGIYVSLGTEIYFYDFALNTFNFLRCSTQKLLFSEAAILCKITQKSPKKAY